MIAEIFRAVQSGEPLKLPLVGSAIAAGFPSSGEDYLDKTFDLNELLITHPAATFFVPHSGLFNERGGHFARDILIMDRSLEAKSGYKQKAEKISPRFTTCWEKLLII